MMLLERWMVAAIVGLGLFSTAGDSPAHSQSRKTQTAQPAPKAVQPDDGPPPDQAVAPDQAAPLEQGMQDPGPPPDETPPPDQTPPPETAKAPEPAPPGDQATPQEPAKNDEPAKQEQPPPAPIPVATQVAPAPPPEPPGPPATPEEAQLQRDTAQLLRLVQQLKVEVERAGSNTLSLAALRKADEIQRLSKDLKERMKERVPQSRPQ